MRLYGKTDQQLCRIPILRYWKRALDSGYQTRRLREKISNKHTKLSNLKKPSTIKALRMSFGGTKSGNLSRKKNIGRAQYKNFEIQTTNEIKTGKEGDKMDIPPTKYPRFAAF